jgi:hypothetical protein
MAVPDTNTFSLQDVVNEVNPTTNDLVDCISDADNNAYDTNYYTSPATSLLEFRNYGNVTNYSSIVISKNGNIILSDSCSALYGPATRYINTTGTAIIQNGDTIYLDSGGVTVLNGNNRYYSIQIEDSEFNLIRYVFKISTLGIVSEFQACSGSDTQAPTVPTNLSASFITETTFTLNWTASTDNVAVTGYRIFKNGLLFATTGNVTLLSVTGQLAGTTSSWTVSAIDGSGNESNQSSGLNVTQSQSGEL